MGVALLEIVFAIWCMDSIKRFINDTIMDKNNYIPHPADISTVELPAELYDLAEQIAKNVHEVWSENRMKEGWTYGEKRDDLKKVTPCLVPYEELPEMEKAYDRNTAFSTLKYIVSLGFKISK